jgi:phospho-N-acetylmuramoyl-pentapeptide-transferase
LIDHVSVFNIFRYITFRAAYAAVIPPCSFVPLRPKLIKYLRKVKIGQEVRATVPRPIWPNPNPDHGRILINLSILVSVLLCRISITSITWVVVGG